jgi:hypothetical protein
MLSIAVSKFNAFNERMRASLSGDFGGIGGGNVLVAFSTTSGSGSIFFTMSKMSRYILTQKSGRPEAKTPVWGNRRGFSTSKAAGPAFLLWTAPGEAGDQQPSTSHLPSECIYFLGSLSGEHRHRWQEGPS